MSNNISVVSKTQRIIVDPNTQSSIHVKTIIPSVRIIDIKPDLKNHISVINRNQRIIVSNINPIQSVIVRDKIPRVYVVDAGPVGPPGIGTGESGDKTYIHIQALPDNVWLIQHNLEKYPSIFIEDSAGDEVIGSIEYTSLNLVTVTHSSAFAGKAYVN